MDINKPISGEFAALVTVLADTMKFATQALAEASALAELLTKRGVVTKADLDKRLSVGQELRESLLKKLDQEICKQSWIRLCRRMLILSRWASNSSNSASPRTERSVEWANCEVWLM